FSAEESRWTNTSVATISASTISTASTTSTGRLRVRTADVPAGRGVRRVPAGGVGPGRMVPAGRFLFFFEGFGTQAALDREARLGGIAPVVQAAARLAGEEPVVLHEVLRGGQVDPGAVLDVMPGHQDHLLTGWERSRRPLVRVVVRRHDHVVVVDRVAVVGLDRGQLGALGPRSVPDD